jgi:hypothetical protein
MNLQPYQRRILAALDREAFLRFAATRLPAPLIRIAIRSTPPNRNDLIWLDEFHYAPVAPE